MREGDPHAIVDTLAGPVRGRNASGALSFIGVPYGEPPVGTMRFRPPRPRAPWTAIRDALDWPPPAPQIALARPDPTHLAAAPPNEDCLFLNVFAPEAGNRPYPVLVYLHGGGWTNYSASTPFFDGSALASRQDIVVVTLNHRLGVLAFLGLTDQAGTLNDAANGGLLDICLALKWVRDNIGAFGGDPSSITLGGQSGGGAKVAALMAFSPAKGLFHRAIIQSSSGSTRITGPQEAKTLMNQLAGEVGLKRNDIRQWQALPIDVLLTAAGKVSGAFRPILDNKHFAAHPFSHVAPRQSAGMPLLVGCTRTETDYHLHGTNENNSLSNEQIILRLRRFLPCVPAEIDRILAAYGEKLPHASARDLLVAITSDYLFKRNTYAIGELQAANGNSPTYAYHFTGLGQKSPHCAELPFLFGTTARYIGTSSEIETLSARVMAAWCAFVRNGHPHRSDLPKWPRYSAARRDVMSIGREWGAAPDPLSELRHVWEGVPDYEYSNSRSSFAAD